MKRNVLIIAVAAGVSWSTVAYAAGLSPLPGGLGAGSAAVQPCDTDGFTISYTTFHGSVTQAVVGGIAAACAGGSLQLTLTDASGIGSGSGAPVTVTGTSATVALTTQPYAGDVAGFQVAISGP